MGYQFKIGMLQQTRATFAEKTGNIHSANMQVFGPDEVRPTPGLSSLCLLRVLYASERTQTIISYAGYHQLRRLKLMYSFDIIRSINPCTSIMLLI